MKKALSLVLALIILLFCLSACGTDKYKDYHATNMEAKTFTTYYDDLIFETLGKKPVVLLDDVFSELDNVRQKSLVENFKNHQVILTSVKGVEL